MARGPEPPCSSRPPRSRLGAQHLHSSESAPRSLPGGTPRIKVRVPRATAPPTPAALGAHRPAGRCLRGAGSAAPPPAEGLRAPAEKSPDCRGFDTITQTYQGPVTSQALCTRPQSNPVRWAFILLTHFIHRDTEAKQLAPGHRASKWQGQDWSPENRIPKSMGLTTTPCCHLEEGKETHSCFQCYHKPLMKRDVSLQRHCSS